MRKLKTLLVLSGLAVSVLTGCKTTTSTSNNSGSNAPTTSATSESTSSSSSVAKTLQSIRIAAEPTKKSYYVGDAFDAAGLSVKAVYNSGEEDLAASAYVLSGFDSATPGEKTITVTFEGKTATFKVNVLAVVAQSIAITSEPTKKDYFVGDEFDPAGLAVKATFNNGSEATLAAADYQLSGFDSATPGEKTITVTYQEKTATFKVNVQAIALASIEIAAQPTKTSYYQDEEFDATGLQVKAVMNNGSKEDLAADAYTITGFDSSKGGVNTVTVTYEEKTATFDLTIIGKDGLEITAPDKVRYGVGEEFDATGLVVKQKYADNTKKTLAAGEYTVTGFDTSSEGEKTVTISVGAQTAEFTVEVFKGAWNDTEKALMGSKLLYELPFYLGLEFAEDGRVNPDDASKKDVVWYSARSQYVAEENDIEEYANLIESFKTAEDERAWKDFSTRAGATSKDVAILGFDLTKNVYQYTRFRGDSDRYYSYQVISVGLDLEGKLLVATTKCDVPYASDVDGIYMSLVAGTYNGNHFNDFENYYAAAVEETFRYIWDAPDYATFFDKLAWPTLEEFEGSSSAGITKEGTYVSVYNYAVSYPYYLGSQYSDYFNAEFEISFSNYKLAAAKQFTAADVDALVAQYDPEAVTANENGSYTVKTVINGFSIVANYGFEDGEIYVVLDVEKYEKPADLPDLRKPEDVCSEFNAALAADGIEIEAEWDDDRESYFVGISFQGTNTDTSEAKLKSAAEQIAQYLPKDLVLTVSLYGDPNSASYQQLFSVKLYYYALVYKSADKAVTVQVIAYTYQGELGALVDIY